MTKNYELNPFETSGGDPLWSVKIIDDESNFHELQVLYGKISVNEIEGDSAQLSFEYDVIDNPWGVDTESIDLQMLLGGILENILTDALEKDDYRIGNEPGTADNQESGN